MIPPVQRHSRVVPPWKPQGHPCKQQLLLSMNRKCRGPAAPWAGRPPPEMARQGSVAQRPRRTAALTGVQDVPSSDNGGQTQAFNGLYQRSIHGTQIRSVPLAGELHGVYSAYSQRTGWCSTGCASHWAMRALYRRNQQLVIRSWVDDSIPANCLARITYAQERALRDAAHGWPSPSRELRSPDKIGCCRTRSAWHRRARACPRFPRR